MAINQLSYLFQFSRKNGIRLPFESVNSSKFRFIFAVGRSGTTWLGKGLSFTESNIQYISEPIPHFLPRIKMGTEEDISFAGSDEKLTAIHPVQLMLKKIQKGLTADDFIPDYFHRKVIRDETNPDFYLIKEVHSHLLVKQLHDALPEAKFVFIVRNPLYVLDSYLTYKNEDSTLWNQEYAHFNLSFKEIISNIHTKYNQKLDHFRLKKLITIAFINNELTNFQSNRIKYHTYNDLCLNPIINFKEIAHFFDFNYDEISQKELVNTMSSKSDKFIHYSIYQNTQNQVNREFRKMDNTQINDFTNVLNDLENQGIKTGLNT